MITHYGLFWSERDVFWGYNGELRGREKPLLGRRRPPTKAERENYSNYRNYIGLYCLYGEGELLYVGEAGLGSKGTIFGRLKKHKKNNMAERWDKFSWFGRKNIEGKVKNRIALKQLEAISIAIINPGFNRQSGSFDEAVQVFQEPHPDSEGNLEAKIDSLSEQIKEVAELQKAQNKSRKSGKN